MRDVITLADWPLWLVVVAFLLATVVIAVVGTVMTRAADRLADLTGIGEALFGAVLLGGSTSLPGIITSVVTAYAGYAELAVSNAVGGIAAQTTFLAIADMAHRGVNLEHAAASVANLVQAALLGTLLSIPLLAMAGPTFDVWGIHPASPALLLAYGFGIRLVARAKERPLWTPQWTAETKEDEPQEALQSPGQLYRMWAFFAVTAVVVASAGFVVAQTGIAIADRTGISQTVVGGLLTAVSTSLPELVVSIAAVRRGALALAVGGVIGGNAFDVLFVAFADVAYRDGSIYHAMTNQQVFIIALTLLLTGVLLLGLLRREKRGIANIGFESFLVLVLYTLAFAVLYFG
ncbi:MAG: sodium:calcium antiporter [Myxococcota bacterium]